MAASGPKNLLHLAHAVPLEKHEQAALFAALKLLTPSIPDLGLVYAIPNAGGFTGGFKHNVARVMAMKREGVKPGVPDLCWPVARGPYHALYVEMKRVKGGRSSEDQKDWQAALTAAGNRAVVACGCQAALDAIMSYNALAIQPRP